MEGIPWSWDRLFLVARIRLTREEASAKHTVAIERQTPEGKDEPIGAESPLAHFPFTAEIGPGGMVGLTVGACLMNITFQRTGVFHYRLKIDGQELGVARVLVAGPGEGGQNP